MPERPGEFHPLLSDNSIKEQGWKNFREFLPLFLRRIRPTRDEIRLIHRLITRGADTQPIPMEGDLDAALHMATRTGSGIETASDTRSLVQTEEPQLLRDLSRDSQILRRGINIALPSGKTAIKVFIPRRGHLRQFGSRTVGEREAERVFAPHYKPLYSVDEHGQPIEETYIGVTDRLDELFNDLSNRSDSLLERAGSLRGRLQAMMYFQLFGASVIHPFSDGNGRAFAGKLIVDLQRIGFPVEAMPGLPEVDPRLKDNFLAGLGPMFLDGFLQKEQIPLMHSIQQEAELIQDPRRYDEYMTTLHDAIAKEVALEGSGFAEPYVVTAASTLLLCLSRDGFVDPSFYERHIDQLKKQQS